MWSVSTILTGLYSFMIEKNPTAGSIETTTQQKRRFAAQSLDYNVRDKNFRELFPNYFDLHTERMAARRKEDEANGVVMSSPSSSTASLDHGHDLNTLLTATAGLVALVSLGLAMMSYFF